MTGAPCVPVVVVESDSERAELDLAGRVRGGKLDAVKEKLRNLSLFSLINFLTIISVFGNSIVLECFEGNGYHYQVIPV